MNEEGSAPPKGPDAEVAAHERPATSADQAGEQRNFRATLQQRWDANPVLVAVGLAFTGATLMLTLVVPIVGWVRDNDLSAANSRLDAERLAHQTDVTQLQGQIDGLQDSLGSIRLALGADADYFDVSRLVVQRETRNQVPAQAASYDGGRFFAPADTDGSTWTYDETTELHSTAENAGLTDEEFSAALRAFLEQSQTPAADIQRVLDGMSQFVVHRWRIDGDKRIAGADFQLNLPTQVIVQRVDHEHYLDLLFGPAQTVEEEDAQRQLYARDESGWILQTQLQTTSLGGQLPLINTLQKQGDTAYAAIEVPLFDVAVNGQNFDEYVIHQDWLIISTPSEVYLVRRLVADEGRSSDAALLNQWLEQFRVCENC